MMQIERRSPRSSGPVIYLAGSDFEGVHGTDVQLVDALAHTAEVIWVDPPHVWRPGMPLGVMDDLLPDAPSIRRVAISVPPGISRPVMRSLATRFYVRALFGLLADWGAEDGVVVAASWLPVLPLVPRRLRRVLFATDDVVAAAGLWGMDPAYLARAREANLRSADEVIAVSQPLADLLHHSRTPPVVIPNGCDPTLFCSDAEPAAGLHLCHPIAGIIGRMNERTDMDYLRAALGAGISLLIVGPRSFADPARDREFAELIKNPQVQWVDHVPREELSRYLAHMDVGLCAYADTPFNRCSSPLKTLDYLAAGIPVVTTGVAPIATRTPNAVYVEDRADSFAERALSVARSPRRPSVLRDEAARHSWDVRARQFTDVLFR